MSDPWASNIATQDKSSCAAQAVGVLKAEHYGIHVAKRLTSPLRKNLWNQQCSALNIVLVISSSPQLLFFLFSGLELQSNYWPPVQKINSILGLD